MAEESERALQATLAASSIGIGRVRNRAIEWANEAFCSMSGYSHEELEGKDIRLLHSGQEEYQRVGRIIYEGGSAETQLIRRDGSTRHILVQVSRIDADSHIFTAVDVTEMKEAEEGLRQKTALLEAQMDSSPDGILVVDDHGHKVLKNERFKEVLKLPQHVFDEEDHEEQVRYLAKRAKNPELFEERIRYLYANRDAVGLDEVEFTDGTVLDRYTAPVLGKNGEHYGRIWTFRDITEMKQAMAEQKRAEEALNESEEKYRMVVENSLVGVYILQDNLMRFANRKWCEIYGYEFGEVVDRLDPLDAVHPADRELVRENIRKRLAGEASYIGYDFRALRKNGEVITVRVLGGSMIYRGRPAVTGTVTDITREKNLESQLRQAQKMEAIGTLAGGVAHDFNNILTTLSGYGTLMQMKTDEGDPRRAYADQILTACQKAANLTRSLLAFSRQQPISLGPVNIGGLVKSTEKLLKRLLTEDIILDTVSSPGDLIIMADATQIDQILFNLATNARDAMPKGGRLSIETGLVDLDAEFFRVQGLGQPGKYVMLSVSDTGVGMDEGTREKIFEPFFTTKEPGKGTGFGLATVYGIVKQHEGYISVHSEPNRGTSFRIYFPYSGALLEAEGPGPEPIRGGKETVLLVEDSDTVRVLIRQILSQYGYHVIEAVDGVDAVEKFSVHSKDINLIIMDSVMPKMNGRAAYDEITKINPRVRVLFMSGYTRDIILDKGIQDGEFEFVSKPVAPGELLRRVREILDKPGDARN